MFCETEAEAFADPARELIFEVGRSYLERHGITAAELVFDPAQHRALLNDGARFQELLQRVALLQGQHTRRPVSERMKELTALAEAAMKRVETQAAGLPAALTDLPEAVAGGLLAGRNLDEWVRAGVAFVRLLKAQGSLAAQAAFCLDVIETGIEGEVRSMADQTLSEILRLKPAAASIFGEDANRRAMIELCLSVLEAKPTGAAVTPVMARLQATSGLPGLPLTQAAMRARLTEMLGGTSPLFAAEPKQEWEALLALKRRIARVELLAADEPLIAALDRRLARFATPELLNPILAKEPDLARKLLFLLQLNHEIADAAARFELLGIIGHYLDARDFRTTFISPKATREDFAELAAAISERLMRAEMPPARKSAYLQLFRDKLATVVKPLGSRVAQRGAGGPEDHVLVQDVRVPLRNWSPAGLMFGPCDVSLETGMRLPLVVVVRNPAFRIEFQARAEILRVAEGMIAARYQCDDPAVAARIRDYFA